jgi:16S rRNA (uracil1498-N3)-methyltransferase
MSYFLSKENLDQGREITLTGDEALHIGQSRRIKVGEKIILQDPNLQRFSCSVLEVDTKMIRVSVDEAITAPIEPDLKISIIQAFVAEQALDFIIQKATELGVTNLYLFESAHSAHHLHDKVENKLARWNKISLEAAKQSNRALPIHIDTIESAKDLDELIGQSDAAFLLSPESKETFKTFNESHPHFNPEKLSVIIGPEGGFTSDEVTHFASAKNITKIYCGPRILRSETAAIYAASLLQNLFGDS